MRAEQYCVARMLCWHTVALRSPTGSTAARDTASPAAARPRGRAGTRPRAAVGQSRPRGRGLSGSSWPRSSLVAGGAWAVVTASSGARGHACPVGAPWSQKPSARPGEHFDRERGRPAVEPPHRPEIGRWLCTGAGWLRAGHRWPCVVRPVEEPLGHVDQRHVGHDQDGQDEEEGGGQGREPKDVAQPRERRTIPIAAAAVGTSSIGRLGRLRKKGVRRVRIT